MERQSKFIVNANRVYEYFGYRHMVPLWDGELVDFFSKLPLKYKIKRNFYDEVLLDTLFSTYMVDYRKKIGVKGKIASILPRWFKLFIRSLIRKVGSGDDINNLMIVYGGLLRSHEVDSYFICSEVGGLNQMIANWCCSKYGCFD